jgi:hypothetical protein
MLSSPTDLYGLRLSKVLKMEIEVKDKRSEDNVMEGKIPGRELLIESQGSTK